MKKQVQEETISCNNEKHENLAFVSCFFDVVFTIASIVFMVAALIDWNILGGDVRRIDYVFLSFLLWIASCQLAPYWNEYSPTRANDEY